MKKIFLAFIFLFFLSVSPAIAHSGRTDSSGGHNCNVGACAGTYHYHNGGTIIIPPIEPYYTPTPKVIYVPSAAIPTPYPTKSPTPPNTPTPTYTPTPTIRLTNTPAPVINQAVEKERFKRNTGFWGFIVSIFGL